MSPREINPVNNETKNGLTGDEVVISGISGLFPNSNNVVEFMDNLYNKVDMVTEDELSFDHAELPKYSGKVSGIDKFDAQYFRVTHAQAHCMEPICRKMMEQTYCALYDAGVQPVTLKGRKIGVFCSAAYAESAHNIIYNRVVNQFSITGSSKAMIANRISYWLDITGPSYSFESISGSISCIEHAVNCIKTGLCEAAIVGGAEFTNHSILAINQRCAGLLSIDGKTRCFDKNGDGYVQSQALNVLFLQKAKDAKRIYAEISNVKAEFDIKEGMELSEKRKTEDIVDFLEKIYTGSGVTPDEVEYVEAQGAAKPETDAIELQAISEVFGKSKPIKVGSVKSNMGSNERTSGICAITKLCLAYKNGKLPGNLHYEEPLDIPALKEGKVEVLTETTPFNRGPTAINYFSYAGLNCHVVLKGHFKAKNPNLYKTNIPRFVPIAGRHDEGLKKIFNILKSQPIDPELLGMLNSINQIDNPGFTCRGYTILDTKDEETISLAESSKLYQGIRRPLCLVYTGMGSQWAGMGAELMRIPMFAAAIEKCRQILEPRGVDIVQILTSPDNTIFDNVMNSFVGIAATQIGLTDILKEMGLVPDFIIGHSLGEMGCAYFDGCFTLEECILTAHARGMVSIQTELIKGSMAAVGLGYKDMLPLCPPEIDIACHNSSEFCTISGPADVMSSFVTELKRKGIFAKEVATSNIAYHSRYIQKAGPEFLRVLKDIIKTPVKRSNKWKTTSWPEEKWNDHNVQYCSPEYHTNNLLSPVYFEEAAKLIPDNAVVVEVAPHGLMQAILKRSHPECTHIPLTRRGHEHPIKFLFEALGNLYQEGYDLKADVLYPKIKYPVSTETPMMSHFIEWYHEEDWNMQRAYVSEKYDKILTPTRMILVSMQDDNFKFLGGHIREGNIVLSEAAILVNVWETLAMYHGADYKKTSVTFQNVQFHAEVFIDLADTIKLKISINKGNKYFEVTRDSNVIVNGYIHIVISESKSFSSIAKVAEVDNDKEHIELTSDDVYNALKIKGHCYLNEFKSIQKSNSQWSTSEIKMTGNWITFLDSLIQLNILATNYNGVSIPKIIKELKINIADYNMKIEEQGDLLNAQLCKDTAITKCGGITIRHMFFNNKPLAANKPDVMKTISFNLQNSTAKFQDVIQNTNCDKTMDKFKDYKLTCTKHEGKPCLKWTEIEANSDRSVKVCFAAPSLRDVQNVLGLENSRKGLGMDFSGIDSSGNRVMGLVAEGALASKIEPDQDLLWPVPEHWTLQEAATVPLPYVHAYYCLVIRGSLRRNQSVLVTGGVGALGQAVISICLSLGCTVYTSVSDAHKKMFLMKIFPELNENNIGYSNDSRFSDMVISNSKNKRCDYVINCSTGNIKELAMKCVGFDGIFLDVNDYDLKLNKDLGMNYLTEERNYVFVNLSSIFKRENVAEKKLLQKGISDGIANGIVKPISYVEYSSDNVERAFRLLSQSKHRGRALINVDRSNSLSVIPRMQLTSDSAYLVVCNDEIHLGVQTINYLVDLGAKHIVFNQKPKEISGFVKSQIESWKNSEVAVTVLAGELEKNNLIEVLKTKVMINGIFILLSRPNDQTENMESDISNVKFLDNVSRIHFPELKYFVVLAHGTININDYKRSALDEICLLRVEDGLPALVVYSALLDQEESNDKSTEIRPMNILTTLKAMEISLNQNNVSVLAYNKKKTTGECSDVIEKLLGIKNLRDIDDSATIEDLATTDIILEEIKSVIKEYRAYDLPSEYARKTKVRSLKYLSEGGKKIKTEDDGKLAVFNNFVDHDEIRATETFVAMHTCISNAESELNLYAKATNLVLIPGFEGHHHIFKPLCEGLKIRATTLQITPDLFHGSIHEIASFLKEQMKRRFILTPKFYLLGYSFGVDVALEIAALLEKEGLVGVIFCLDSSPDALRAHVNAHLGNLSEAQLENAVITHLFNVMSGQKCKSLENDLNNLNNWEEKVTRCVDRLKGIVKYSNEYKRSVIEAFYKKIKLAKEYDAEFKLKSKIVLLKGISNLKDDLPADYGLSKYAVNPVEVIEIFSDLTTAADDSNVPNIVNNFLDPMLLEEFKTKNLCECYSTRAA